MAAAMAAPFQGAPEIFAWRRVDAYSGQLALALDEQAAERVMADWYLDGRVEVEVRGRYLAFEVDGPAGRMIRIDDPGAGMPLAWFERRRRGGRVRFVDGGRVGWIAPSFLCFEYGFVGTDGKNLVRFSADGSAISLMDDHPAPDGSVSDLTLLLALGWFLLLLDGVAPRRVGPRRPIRGRTPGAGARRGRYSIPTRRWEYR